MNILWLTTRPPYPADAGGKIAVYWRVRELAALGHRIHLVASCSGESDAALAEARAAIVPHVNGGSVLFAPSVGLPRKMAAMARLPWGAARRRLGPETLQAIESAARDIDVVLVDQSGMFPSATQLRALHHAPEVVFQFADAGDSLRLTAESAAPPQRAALLREARAYDRLDRAIVDDPLVRRIGFVSQTEFDRNLARHPAQTDRFSFHPLPYPFEDVGVTDRSAFGRPARAVFVANFSDPGNRVAARWLVDDVLPLLDPGSGVRLTIAGRRASELSLNESQVDVISDPVSISEVYESADLALVPVRGGGGVRLKLLEAMAHRLPIVTTSLGTAGTTFRADAHVLISDRADGFAQAMTAVAADEDAARRRADSAFEELREHHSPRAVGARLHNLLEAVHEGPRPSRHR